MCKRDFQRHYKIDRQQGGSLWGTDRASCIPLHFESTMSLPMVINSTSLLPSLHHPNIIKFHDSFKLGFSYVLVTEQTAYSLAKYLEKIQSPICEAFISSVCRQLISVLVYLEDLRLVHCCIDPGTVFFAHDGSLKIGGFGQSRLEGEESRLSTSPTAAPELAFSRSVSCKNDVWSVGMLAYTMLVGRQPFDRAKLDNLKAHISEDLFNFIIVCLRVDSLSRPNAGQLSKHPLFCKTFSQNQAKL